MSRYIDKTSKAYIEAARKALALHRRGKDIQEIKKAVGDRYAEDTKTKIAVANQEARLNSYQLTDDEFTLLNNIAEAERRALERGSTCSPKLKYCGLAFWPRTKATRLARKRLDTHRHGECTSQPGTGLGLLNAYHGGYVRLRPAGWALIHALEGKPGEVA